MKLFQGILFFSEHFAKMWVLEGAGGGGGGGGGG